MTPRTTYDVSSLPTVVFGHRSLSWWGTIGFMVVEGTTLIIAVASYLYLRKNFTSWPPPPTPDPELLIPTINLVLLLLAIVPMLRVDHAARRSDLGGVRRWLAVGLAFGVVTAGLRFLELGALNTRWDEHAYGSAAWAILVGHGTLLFVDVLETSAILAIFTLGPVEEKHFADASDAGHYQVFLSLAYVPLYVVLFWLPRWM